LLQNVALRRCSSLGCLQAILSCHLDEIYLLLQPPIKSFLY